MSRQPDTWVFDLDNTLYPPTTGLADQINAHIRAYLCTLYGTDETGARHLQAQLVADHGTTLRGLMATRGIDPHDYLSFERSLDYGVLTPNADLAAALRALPGRRLVFTNGTAYHAEQALQRLGLTRCFDGVFDILAGQLLPKPFPESYQRFLTAFSVEPARAVFFDDLPVNLTVPEQLGMATVWVHGPPGPGPAPYEVLGARRRRVWDLVGFLHSLTAPAVKPWTM
ncbi:pyrimidine 5'-nucleotidase [Kribbella flavida DSM 17836]|uniref:Pyrimidine 5'-nucleotidase n=1 Tax=Kribbella flavida (strain DSM 17836 / JCM 10339 / NBRC 14399) TaxID=479435 RepID=D2Q140_KRIFD|nr:pyrimidine 5'-nucleotidase [Kribbella flavida]ADB35741.1 pyrimidine 5'-nucleotidase [Kribbella flavida DSM 17836]